MSHLEGIVNSILHSSSLICASISSTSNRFANESDSSYSLRNRNRNRNIFIGLTSCTFGEHRT